MFQALVVRFVILILFLVKEEVILGRIVRPDVFDAFVDFAVVFELFEVLNQGRADRLCNPLRSPS